MKSSHAQVPITVDELIWVGKNERKWKKIWSITRKHQNPDHVYSATFLYIRALEMSQRGTNKFLIAPAKPKLAPLGSTGVCNPRQNRKMKSFIPGFWGFWYVWRRDTTLYRQSSKMDLCQVRSSLFAMLRHHCDKFQKPQSKTRSKGFVNASSWQQNLLLMQTSIRVLSERVTLFQVCLGLVNG